MSFHQDLEVGADERFERRDWRVQRAGRVLGVLVLAVALTGLLGGTGPLNPREVDLGGGARLRYERVARHGAPTALAFVVPRHLVRAGTVRVSIDHSFLQGTELQAVVPEPETTGTSADQVVYAFPAGHGTHDILVEIQLRPDNRWHRRGTASVGGGPTVAFSQFVLP